MPAFLGGGIRVRNTRASGAQAGLASITAAVFWLVLFCESSGATENGKTVEADLNGLHVVFDAATGSIVEMSYPGAGKMLSTSPERASIVDLACPVKEFEALRLASRFSHGTQIQKTADTVTVRWDQLGASRNVDPSASQTDGVTLQLDDQTGIYKWVRNPGSAYYIGGKVSASVAMKAAPDGRSIIMTCSIQNHSKTAVRQVLFPDFDGFLPFAGQDKTWFRSGGINMKPFEKIRTPERGCGFWPQDPGMNGLECVPGAYFGTTLMIEQWLDYGGLGGGLSLFRKRWGWEPNDSPWISRGTVWLKVSEIDNKMRLSWANRVEIKPGEKWESAEFWLTPHAGGWARGIAPYRDWARQNIKRKYPVPKHVRDGLGFRTLWMSTSAFPGDPDPQHFCIWKARDLPMLAQEARECGLTEMCLWMWNAGAQVPITPPYPQLGTEDEFAQAIAECRKIGVNVSLFVSFYSLAEPTASRLGLQMPPEGGWTYHPELMPCFNPYYSHKGGTAGANMNDPKWRADVLKSCKYLIDRLTPSIAWDQYAGFPGTPNLYELTDQIRELAKAKDPESTFSGESFVNIEMESKYLDYLWSWGSYGMFGDLHAFSSVFSAPRVNPNINTSWQEAKYCFMDNLYMDVMPRKPGSTNGSAAIGDYPELKKTLVRCAKLRRQFLPYFVDGTLIGNCILTQECPDAHVCSYVLPGKVLTIVMNESKERVFKLAYDLAPWIESASGAGEIRVYDESGELVSTEGNAKARSELSTKQLSGSELAFYEFAPK